MRIALDWDDTYTADPELWEYFISGAKKRGHKIVFVTCRRDTEENREIIQHPTELVVFTNLAPKRDYMERLNMPVDIWIDDLPECVKEGR